MPITSKTARALFAGAPHLLAAAPAVVMMMLWWDRLPDSLATRFGSDGAVSDQMSRTGLLVSMLVLSIMLAVVFGILFGLSSERHSTRGMSPRWFAAVSWATAGLLAPLLLTLVLVNVDVTDPNAAEMPINTLLYGLGAAALAGAIGFFLAPADPVTDPAIEPRQMEFGPTEQVSWKKNISTPWLALFGTALLALGVFIGWTADWVAGLVTAGSGIVVCLFMNFAMTVDRNGLTVSLAALSFLRIRIPLYDIAKVEVEETTPAQFAGLGYRIVPGGSGVILRQGPTLIITRASGRWFAVTVDDAETAAGVLNGLLARKG